MQVRCFPTVIGIADILMQPGDAELALPQLSDYHLIVYLSKKLNPAQPNYNTYD
ncbi:hypothetical protein VTO42DRAFT_1040 [Malbranchea cinnamomea]